MKIFLNRKIHFVIAILLTFYIASSCKKSNTRTDGENTMVEAFMRAQKSKESAHTKTDTKENITSPLQRISFNRDGAIVDEGSKTFNESRAIELVRDMKNGWNLGNTFDATGGGNSLKSETSWGQPKTTKEMIDGIAAAGFKTIRIPVSWYQHISDSKYTIYPAWMSRVKEVVDWAIADGLYVVINIHHDNYGKDAKMPALAGFYPTDENFENSADFVCNIWAQISLAFNNGYDEHLIFETLNEPRLAGTGEEWWYNPLSPKSQKAMNNLNKLNQAILDVIRDSGGNNKKRLVAFPSLQASPEAALAETFKMPQDYDGSKERLIVSVHMYTPYSFAGESPGIREYSDNVKKEFTSMFKKLDEHFIKNGYAVYIGEYGATNKNNLEDRIAWFRDFVREAGVYGMPCFLWDNGYWRVEEEKYAEHFGFYNRNAQTWYFPEILEAIISESK